MNDEERRAFEQQFDEKPTHISSQELLTEEVVAVFIHAGGVDVPIYPPPDEEPEPDDIGPFVLQLTPAEARNLAGTLIYAAGRADETHDHCLNCGDTLHDHDQTSDN